MSAVIMSWPKFLVVVLIASLQCVAPLIHAHTNGASDHSVHTHAEEAGAAPILLLLDEDHHQHGQAIGVAKEYKRDYTLILFDATVLTASAPLAQIVSLAPDLWRSFAAPDIRYTRPTAQAP